MGTNYYALYNSKNSNKEVELHIGYNMYNWKFTFRGYDSNKYEFIIKSFREWINVITENKMKIVDDYNNEYSLDGFKNLIESNSRLENDSYKFSNIPLKDMWLDDEENVFSGIHFRRI